jgi:hypothetical protein
LFGILVVKWRRHSINLGLAQAMTIGYLAFESRVLGLIGK